MSERRRTTIGPSVRRRLWRPENSIAWLLGLLLAAVLPWVATWMSSEFAAFRRFVGLPFWIAIIAATLIGRLSAGLIAAVTSGFLLSYFELAPTGRLGADEAADLIGMVLFVAAALLVGYTVALKDAATEDASQARTEIEDLARQLVGERDTMQQILHQMPNGVIVADADGILVMQNERSHQLLGYGYEPGHHLESYDARVPWIARRADGEVYAPGDYPIMRAVRHGEVVLGETMTLERTDGSTVLIEVEAAPIRSQGTSDIVGAVAVFQDVTERIEMQDRLRRATERLHQIQAVTDAALTGLGFDELADRLLHTVRRILATDSATLLLVDRHRGVLVEHMTVGVETDGPGLPIPIGQGIAGTIAKTRTPRVIDDISSHPVVRHWLTDTMSSLMGAPLMFRGRVTGVIHVASRSPRHFTPEEVGLLELAANRVASALERASLYESRSAMSRALQRSLAPAALPRIEGVEVSALYQPFSPDDEIGGDFYDVFPHGEGTWGVIVGDVSGKGPDAAAVMGLAAHTVRAIAAYETRPSAVLAGLNDALLGAERVPAERFCTACHMRLHPGPDHLRVTVCLAGHPRPFVVRRNGDIERAGEPGTLLGSFPTPRLHDVVIDLRDGDAMIAYTDGLVERRGADISQGETRLVEVLCRTAGSPCEDVVATISSQMIESAQLDDDVAIVAFRKV